MKVKNFMVPLEKLVYITEDATIQETSERIINAHLGSLLVVRHKQGQELPTAVGLITKSDLLRVWSSGIEGVGKDPISKHLKKRLVLVYDDEDRSKCAELMVKNGFHHVLVANKAKEIVGLVSSLDLAREFYEDSKDVFRRLFGIPKGEIRERIQQTLLKLDRLLPDPDADSYLLGP